MTSTSGADTAPPPPPPPPPGGERGPRPGGDLLRDLALLRRTPGERKVAGVAGGIARHFDVDPLVVRVVLVVLTIFGGGGLLLYGAVWLVVPEDGEERAIINLDDGLRSAVLAVVGVLAALSLLSDNLGGPGVPWPGVVVGVILLVIFGRRNARGDRAARDEAARRAYAEAEAARAGAQQYADAAAGSAMAQAGLAQGTAGAPGAAWAGYTAPPTRPRRRGPLLFPFTLALAAFAVGVLATLDLAGLAVAPAAYPALVLAVTGVMLLVGSVYGRAGGLVLVGLVAAGATGITSAAQTVGDASIGRSAYVVSSAADLRSSYQHGVGELSIDLSGVSGATDLAALDGRTVRVEQGIGHLLVTVPDDGLRVVVRSQVDLGESLLFGTTRDDQRTRATTGSTDEPTLTIDADLGIGQVEVRTSGAQR